jgi:hypothetical protein
LVLGYKSIILGQVEKNKDFDLPLKDIDSFQDFSLATKNIRDTDSSLRIGLQAPIEVISV